MAKSKKKADKNASLYIFPILLTIICISYAFRAIYYYIDTEVVKYDKIENAVSTQGVFIRNEITTHLPADIEDGFIIPEGEKVAFGTKILEISKSVGTDSSLSLKITKLNERIEEIKKSEVDNNFFSKDKEKITTTINEKITAIKTMAINGNIAGLEEAQEELAASLYKKSLIYGNGSFSGKNLEQLEAEKSNLESIYQNSIDVVIAQSSGIVSYKVDGYEQILTPMNINSFNITGIKDIIDGLTKADNSKKDTEEDNFGVKVVDNFEWYISSVLSSSQAEGLVVGKKLKLRFNDYDNIIISGEIVKISEAENDEVLIVIKCNEQFDDFYRIRLARIDIIKDYFEGYLVPSICIVNKDDMTGVYVNKGGIVKYIPISIVVTKDKKTLIRNIKKEELEESERWYTLKEFDEVIKSVKRVRENQLLPGSI